MERIWTLSNVGGEAEQDSSNGKFVVVELKAWFDPSTISARRGNGPLTPNDRVAVLKDEVGHVFELSRRGANVLPDLDLHSTPLTTALRPGESYVTYFVFEVPATANDLKLWLHSGDEVDAML